MAKENGDQRRPAGLAAREELYNALRFCMHAIVYSPDKAHRECASVPTLRVDAGSDGRYERSVSSE